MGGGGCGVCGRTNRTGFWNKMSTLARARQPCARKSSNASVEEIWPRIHEILIHTILYSCIACLKIHLEGGKDFGRWSLKSQVGLHLQKVKNPPVLHDISAISYPERSLSMTIFCRPEEMLQLASTGGEAMCSEDRPGVIWTLDGLDRAVLTSRRIRGRGPSLEAALCKEDDGWT